MANGILAVKFHNIFFFISYIFKFILLGTKYNSRIYDANLDEISGTCKNCS